MSQATPSAARSTELALIAGAAAAAAAAAAVLTAGTVGYAAGMSILHSRPTWVHFRRVEDRRLWQRLKTFFKGFGRVFSLTMYISAGRQCH